MNSDTGVKVTPIKETKGGLELDANNGNDGDITDNGQVKVYSDKDRETWGKKADFLLSVIGFAVDLGNVWRFPYICYKNGGGAFLIPYLTMAIFCGIPLFYMELALGQYHRTGAISLWTKISPLFKGIGYALCIVDLYVGMFYNTVIAWACYYVVSSFTSTLPWTTCDNTWNTDDCVDFYADNVTITNTSVAPAAEFFDRHVLEFHLAHGIGGLGNIKWQLAVCLFFVFLVVYFSIWKGIKSSGKVVWITATLPYIILLILLIRVVLLEGSASGIRYYLTPTWSRLLDITVWTDAAVQIFFSLGPGFGVILALSSYNKFHNNCYRDALVTSSANCLTSFLSGFVIFAVLGFMAHRQGVDIDKVATDGPGLVFVAYPEAIAQLPGSVAWSIIFFIMVVTLGLDTTFGGLEAIITALSDEFPNLIGAQRELFVALLITTVYLGSLSTLTYGGQLVINLLAERGATISLLVIVFLEVAVIAWVYGVGRFSSEIKEMVGFKPGIFWRVCWVFISPLCLLFIIIASIVFFQPLTLGPEYTYPQWAQSVGWVLMFSSLICIPIYAIYKLLVTSGSFTERLRKSLYPPKIEEEEDKKPTLELSTV